jgi:hypothetical protein
MLWAVVKLCLPVNIIVLFGSSLFSYIGCDMRPQDNVTLRIYIPMTFDKYTYDSHQNPHRGSCFAGRLLG